MPVIAPLPLIMISLPLVALVQPWVHSFDITHSDVTATSENLLLSDSLLSLELSLFRFVCLDGFLSSITLETYSCELLKSLMPPAASGFDLGSFLFFSFIWL